MKLRYVDLVLAICLLLYTQSIQADLIHGILGIGENEQNPGGPAKQPGNTIAPPPPSPPPSSSPPSSPPPSSPPPSPHSSAGSSENDKPKPTEASNSPGSPPPKTPPPNQSSPTAPPPAPPSAPETSSPPPPSPSSSSPSSPPASPNTDNTQPETPSSPPNKNTHPTTPPPSSNGSPNGDSSSKSQTPSTAPSRSRNAGKNSDPATSSGVSENSPSAAASSSSIDLLPTTEPSQQKKGGSSGTIIGAVVGCVVGLALIGGFIAWCKKGGFGKRRQRGISDDEDGFKPNHDYTIDMHPSPGMQKATAAGIMDAPSVTSTPFDYSRRMVAGGIATTAGYTEEYNPHHQEYEKEYQQPVSPLQQEYPQEYAYSHQPHHEDPMFVEGGVPIVQGEVAGERYYYQQHDPSQWEYNQQTQAHQQNYGEYGVNPTGMAVDPNTQYYPDPYYQATEHAYKPNAV